MLYDEAILGTPYAPTLGYGGVVHQSLKLIIIGVTTDTNLPAKIRLRDSFIVPCLNYEDKSIFLTISGEKTYKVEIVQGRAGLLATHHGLEVKI